MSSDLLAELTYRPVDVCYTDLVPTYPWENKFKTVKWHDVVKHKAFANIRTLATRIFDTMERAASRCPTVTTVEGKVQMTWKSESRVFRVELRSCEPIVYFRGHTHELYELDPVIVEDVEKFFELLPIFAQFVDPPKITLEETQ